MKHDVAPPSAALPIALLCAIAGGLHATGASAQPRARPQSRERCGPRRTSTQSQPGPSSGTPSQSWSTPSAHTSAAPGDTAGSLSSQSAEQAS
jgi:hypothetical protein